MSLPFIKLTRGVPPVESFPTAQLSECATSVLEKWGDVVLQYAPARGFEPLRAWIAGQAGVAADRVIIGQGSLILQDFFVRYLLRPGDIVYVEMPSYDRTLTIIRRAGGKLVGFTLGDDGPDVDAIEARLRGGERPKAFYIIPDFQNPSGTVLALEKRQRLARLAQEYGFYIIEDVPYRELRYRGEEFPTLFEFAPDRVLQMSSFSKLVSPGLRVGYVIAPESLAGPLAKTAEDTYINASYLNQAIIYEFIDRGWLEPNLAALRELYEPRLDATLGALDQHFSDIATWWKPDGGFFVGVNLNAPVDTDELLARAAAANLALTDGRGFYPDRDVEGFVRLPFCALTPEEIQSGVARLADVLHGMR